VVSQEEIAAKLRQMTDGEWRRYLVVGLPSRLQ
jgi:hypothetical protein